MADDEALRLLEEALHLLANGEFAPGGHESWPRWIAKAEAYLRIERRRQFRASLRSGPAGDTID